MSPRPEPTPIGWVIVVRLHDGSRPEAPAVVIGTGVLPSLDEATSVLPWWRQIARPGQTVRVARLVLEEAEG